LTPEEIEALTLEQFEALEERRQIRNRYTRFNAGLITSALCNSRLSGDAEPMSPFDFLPGFEDPEAEERERDRKLARNAVRQTLTRAKSPADAKNKARLLVKRMRADGIEDPEDLILEVFPGMEL
jgi:hypothetical protein